VSTERHTLSVSGVEVEVVRKPIKNLHLAVYPPAGRVRIAVPPHIDDEAVRLAVVSKLGWIRRQQKSFAEQQRQSRREMVAGESHYVFGRRYRLRIEEADAPPRVTLHGNRYLMLRVRPGTTPEAREEILNRWHRRRLKERVPELIAVWEPVIGVEVAEWGVRRSAPGGGAATPKRGGSG
jgi:predicted metal-dependent hydrolase